MLFGVEQVMLSYQRRAIFYIFLKPGFCHVLHISALDHSVCKVIQFCETVN